MDDGAKQKYHDLHEEDDKRYKKQLQDLDKKGFFTMDDGSKSSDHTAKIKKKRVTKTAKEEEKEDQLNLEESISDSEDEKPVKIKAKKSQKQKK